jgi:AcrR family transcriptional regulator
MGQQSTPKSEAIVRTARSLFFKFGFKRVSVDEICKKADVSKMTFYKYFADKEALIVHLLDLVYKEGLAKFKETISGPGPFAAKMQRWVEIKAELGRQYGREFIEELLHDPDSACAAFITQKSAEAMHTAMQVYTAAQAKGEIRKDIKIELIVYLLDTMREKIMADPKLPALYPDLYQLNNDLFSIFFYGIVPRKK